MSDEIEVPGHGRFSKDPLSGDYVDHWSQERVKHLGSDQYDTVFGAPVVTKPGAPVVTKPGAPDAPSWEGSGETGAIEEHQQPGVAGLVASTAVAVGSIAAAVGVVTAAGRFGLWFGRRFRFATIGIFALLVGAMIAGAAWDMYQAHRRSATAAALPPPTLQNWNEWIPGFVEQEVGLFRQHGARSASYRHQVVQVAEAYIRRADILVADSQHEDAIRDISTALLRYSLLRELNAEGQSHLAAMNYECDRLMREVCSHYPRARLQETASPIIHNVIRDFGRQYGRALSRERASQVHDAVLNAWLERGA